MREVAKYIGQHSNKVRAFIWQAVLVSVVMRWITLEEAQLAAWGMFLDAGLSMFVEANTVSKVRVGERITEGVERQMEQGKGLPMTTRILALALVLWAAPAFAQQLEDPKTITAASTSCTSSSCIETSMKNVWVTGINVEGSGTFTLEIEASKNLGTTWYAFKAIDESDPDSLIDEITAAGNYNVVNSGITNLRIRASLLSSGTPVVTLTRGFVEALNTLGGSGGGGGGGTATEYQEGAVDASITGVASMMEDAGNTLVPLQGSVADGLLVNLGSNNDVTVSSSALPTGAATAANQSTAIGHVDGLETLIGTTNTSLSTLDGRVDTLESLIGTTNTSLAIVDNVVFGAGTEATAQRVTIATDSTGVLSVDDNGGSLTIDGTIACSNCSGSGASTAEDTASANLDVLAPSGMVRASSPANTSGANGDWEPLQGNGGRLWVDASGVTLTVGDGSGSLNTIVDSGTITTVSTVTSVSQLGGVALPVEDVAETAAGVGIYSMSVRRDTAASSAGTSGDNATINTDSTGRLWTNTELPDAVTLADDTANPSIPGVAAYLMAFDGTTWDRARMASDMTIGTAWATTSPGSVAMYSDFDGSAIPTATNVDTEGEAVPIAASIKGVQYMMLTSEDGSLQYGTATTPLVVGDGTGALNTIVDSGTLTAVTAITNPVTVTDGTGALNVIVDSSATVTTNESASATGGADGCAIVSAASTNATNCKASAGKLYMVRVVNTTATLYYLRLYNLTAAPTCSSATGFVESIPIPASTTGAGIVIPMGVGEAYSAGISYCLTGGSSSTDNTNAATGLFGRILYK